MRLINCKSKFQVTARRYAYSTLRMILSIFYNKDYLVGRYFEHSKGGYLWAIRGVLWQKIFGFNRSAPYPVSPLVSLSNPKNLHFHPDNIDNLQSPGVYFQNPKASITLGKGTYVSPNVGLITQNHDVHDLENHEPGKPINIGQNCWLGMNCIVLPGVHLGDATIVGAGSVVTKPFPDGNVVIAGNPAKPIRHLVIPPQINRD